MEFSTEFISRLNSGEYVISKLTQDSALKSFGCKNADYEKNGFQNVTSGDIGGVSRQMYKILI